MWAVASWTTAPDVLRSAAVLSVLQVSAFVRAMLYDPEMRLNGGSVIAYDPCPGAATEASLLCTVLDLYSRGALPGGLQEIHEEMVRLQQLPVLPGSPCTHTCSASNSLTITAAIYEAHKGRVWGAGRHHVAYHSACNSDKCRVPRCRCCCCCCATLLCVQGFGVAAEHMDLVLVALWQHFRRRQRWGAAADFFRELMATYSPAALLLAAAERAQGLGPGTSGALSELLARPTSGLAATPSSHASHTLVPATMVALGFELLEQGESDAAASLARRALAAWPRCRPAWLLLAKCFVVEGQYAAALVALNVVPTPPLPAAEVELLHVVPPPAPKDTTQPQVGAGGSMLMHSSYKLTLAQRCLQASSPA